MYKLISDGTIHGTKLINKETGEILQGVGKIEWSADAADKGGLCFAKITLFVSEVEVEMEDIRLDEETLC